MSKLYIHIGVLSITCIAFFSKSCMVFSFFAFNLYVLVRTTPILCIFFEHSCTIVHNLTKSGKTVLFLYINNKKLCNLTFRQTQSFFTFYNNMYKYARAYFFHGICLILHGTIHRYTIKSAEILFQNFIQKRSDCIRISIWICQTGFSMSCPFDRSK